MERSKVILNFSIILFSVILSIGIIISAFIISKALKEFSSVNNTIDVKGLAEKNIKSDNAILVINIQGKSSKVENAYLSLSNEVKKVLAYLEEQNISKEFITIGNENLEPVYKHVKEKIGDEVNDKQVFQYYLASVNFTIKSQDVNKISKIYAKADKFFKINNYNTIISPPKYLVSNLEEIKMSLITSATDNAKVRASEFAKSGKIKVGPMRFAKQGAFYILALDGSSDDYEDYYGGIYDKTTIDKKAKVVVTVKFGIK